MLPPASGARSIQAIYNSIDRIFDQQPRLLNYEITALTGGRSRAKFMLAIECAERQTDKSEWDRC